MAVRFDVEARGLGALSRSLGKVDPQIRNDLKRDLADAAKMVVDRAAPTVPVRTGRTRANLRATATAKGAVARWGGTKTTRHVPWLEFGGRVGRNRSIDRPFVKSGRYFWPAVSEASEEVNRRVAKAIDRALAQVERTSTG